LVSAASGAAGSDGLYGFSKKLPTFRLVSLVSAASGARALMVFLESSDRLRSSQKVGSFSRAFLGFGLPGFGVFDGLFGACGIGYKVPGKLATFATFGRL